MIYVGRKEQAIVAVKALLIFRLRPWFDMTCNEVLGVENTRDSAAGFYTL
jgi:hypothetical protein